MNRYDTRTVLLDHVQVAELDARHLSDRDLLELVFHMMLERRTKRCTCAPAPVDVSNTA